MHVEEVEAASLAISHILEGSDPATRWRQCVNSDGLFTNTHGSNPVLPLHGRSRTKSSKQLAA